MTNVATALAIHAPASQQDGTYPRPLLVRDRHVLLDRQVGFAHDDELVGLAQGWQHTAEPFTRTIQLPFPPESELSGIDEPSYHPCVWYRIELTADDLVAAGHGEGRRLILHFGAVDHETAVFVDGQQVGTHVGGQVPFGFDITDALDPAKDSHIVTVRAYDDPLETRQPRGKQDWEAEPHIIWYRRSTGIWRSVWLESVPALRIERLCWRTDIDAGRVDCHLELNIRPVEAVRVDIALAFDGRCVAEVQTVVKDRVCTIPLALPDLAHGQGLFTMLWSPNNPALVDAGVIVHGPSGDDEVRSYLGIRSVGAADCGHTLNGNPFYLRSVLEQGYWRESCFTPPSVDAMRAEVELILSLGFNHARIHQKTEDPRFLFFCDKLGLALWGETAAAFTFDQFAVGQFTHEWTEIVRSYEGHPSIIAWTPMNESWGVPNLMGSPAQRSFATGIAELTRALDPTRPVISNDGWEHTDSDFITIHDYESNREVLTKRYSESGIERLFETTGPAGRRMIADCRQQMRPVILVTEFGGVRFVQNDQSATWGYSSATDPDDYARRVKDIVEPIRASEQVAGFCWTQLTDTLQEANGLCYENRTPKLPVDELRAIFGE